MSLTRIMITSNEDWVVPATPGERRYFVLDCLDPFPGLDEDDPARVAYFKELYRQADDGGMEAMMWELQHETDIHSVNLRKPPITEGLKAQMAQTFSKEEEWLLGALIQGGFTDRDGTRIGDEWPLDNPLEIKTEDLVKSYRDHIQTYSGSAPGTSKVIAFLKKTGTISPKRLTVHGERKHGYVLSLRREWRERFARDYQYNFDDEE